MTGCVTGCDLPGDLRSVIRRLLAPDLESNIGYGGIHALCNWATWRLCGWAAGVRVTREVTGRGDRVTLCKHIVRRAKDMWLWFVVSVAMPLLCMIAKIPVWCCPVAAFCSPPPWSSVYCWQRRPCGDTSLISSLSPRRRTCIDRCASSLEVGDTTSRRHPLRASDTCLNVSLTALMHSLCMRSEANCLSRLALQGVDVALRKL